MAEWNIIKLFLFAKKPHALYRKFQGIYQKNLELINEFNKVTE